MIGYVKDRVFQTGAEIARERMIRCVNMDRRNVPVFRFRKVRSERPFGLFSPMVAAYDGTGYWEKYKRSRKAAYRWEQRL